MHRRRSLGLCMLLLMVFLAGTASAADAPAAPEAKVDKSFDLLSWAWEWLSSLVTGGETSRPGGEYVTGGDGGVFIDPCGNS